MKQHSTIEMAIEVQNLPQAQSMMRPRPKPWFEYPPRNVETPQKSNKSARICGGVVSQATYCSAIPNVQLDA